MEQEIYTTQQKILMAAKEEFLRLGFQKASLRSIVKAAGVTTGALYGYYPDKNALFDALVRETADGLYQLYAQKHMDFENLSAEEQKKIMIQANHFEVWACFEYVYDHFDSFRLLICCAEGTSYEDYLHRLAEIEVESTRKFADTMKALGSPVLSVPEDLIHILSSAYLSGFFEVVSHNMPKDTAREYVGQLTIFFTAGWQKIMGLL